MSLKRMLEDTIITMGRSTTRQKLQKELLNVMDEARVCDAAGVEHCRYVISEYWGELEPNPVTRSGKPVNEVLTWMRTGLKPSQLRALELISGKTGFYKGGPLAFVNFSRPLVALQLMVRVLDYSTINQGAHSLCGPAAMAFAVLRDDPERYVKYVMDVATTRHGTLVVGNGAGLHVHVRKSSSLLQKKARGDPECKGKIPEADYIALASLKNSETILPYRSMLTNTWCQGATGYWSLMDYMEKVGFRHCEDHTHGGNPLIFRGDGGQTRLEAHLRMAQQFLEQRNPPYTVIVIGSRGANLAYKAMASPKRSRGLEALIGGHFVLLRHLSVGANGVQFGIVTWAAETDVATAVMVPWEDLQKLWGGFVCGQP
jgi:hypothetical protein